MANVQRRGGRGFFLHDRLIIFNPIHLKQAATVLVSHGVKKGEELFYFYITMRVLMIMT